MNKHKSVILIVLINNVVITVCSDSVSDDEVTPRKRVSTGKPLVVIYVDSTFI